MIENILRPTHWYLAESYFNTVGLHALRLIEAGKSLDSLKIPPPQRNFSANIIHAEAGDLSYRALVNNEGKRVAVVPLHGTMTKYGGMCSYGTADLAKMVNEANQNKDQLDGILFDVYTPGGAGDSIEILERAIEASELPIAAFVEMAASAGQWVVSAIAKKGGTIIVDSLQNTVMGSIGSYIMYQNIAAKLEKDGIKVEIVRAPQSVDKIKFNSVEELTDEIRDEIKADLKMHTDIFINAIKDNYGDKLKLDTEKLFTGGTFYGNQAIEIGLADKQGSISDAFNTVLDMSNNQKKKKSIYNQNMNMFKRLGLSFSIAQKLSAEELENISQAEDKLAEIEVLKEQNGTLQTENATLKQSLTDKEAQHATLLEERDTVIAEQKAQLEETPAAAATTAVSEADATAEAQAAEQAKKYETSADRELAQMKGQLKVSK